MVQRIAEKSPVKLALGTNQMTAQEYEQHKADLYNATPGNLHETDGWECDICKNKGFIAVVQFCEMYGYYAEALRPCKCQRVRNALLKLKKSGLQDVVKKYTFERYEAPDAWQQGIKETALRFCTDKENHWFFMGGQSGAGKTHLCTAIAIDLLRGGKDVRYMVWPKEIQAIQAVVNDAERYNAIMDGINNAEVLYIDDLFKHAKDEYGNQRKPSDPEVRRAFEIINYRCNVPGLTTIISCEWTMEELIDIDEATAGRISELTKDVGYCINIGKSRARNWRLRGVDVI